MTLIDKQNVYYLNTVNEWDWDFMLFILAYFVLFMIILLLSLHKFDSYKVNLFAELRYFYKGDTLRTKFSSLKVTLVYGFISSMF